MLVIKGIKDNIFTSKPIQAPSQFVEEIEINELMIIIKKNKIFKLFKINKVYFDIYYIMVYMHKRFWFFRNI